MNSRNGLLSEGMAVGWMATAVLGVMLATMGCVTGPDQTRRGPSHQAESVSPTSSAADDFIARDAVETMDEDQRRAATAIENTQPAVPHRDRPLGPLRRR